MKSIHYIGRVLVFVLLFVFSFQGLCQKQIIQIKDITNKLPVSFAKIQTQSSIQYATDKGFYSWNLKLNPKITLQAWNFADTTLSFTDTDNQDTLIVYLRAQPEQLNEILVKSENSWLQNEMDGFERWQKGWIFLVGKKLYVTNNNLDLSYITSTPKVGGRYPKQLYLDNLLNVFLISKDSVQQLFVTDSMVYFYPQRSKRVFKTQIQSVLAEVPEGLIMRQTREVDYDWDYDMRQTGTRLSFNVKHPPLHNCGAIVKLRGIENNREVYKCLDSNAYEDAVNAFNIYIGYHIRFWYISEDSGYFSLLWHKKKGQALSSYQNLFAINREVYFIPNQKNYSLLDPYSKQQITFNQELKAIKKESFDFTDCPDEAYLYIDPVNQTKWLQRRKRGLDVLENLDDQRKKITVDAFAKNIRLYNGMVFYINQWDKFRVKDIEMTPQ